MCLDKLSLTGNPWRSPSSTPPARRRPLSRSASGFLGMTSSKPVSATTSHFIVPPLTELCLRVLLATIPRHAENISSKGETVLEALYALPLSGTERYPVHVLETLRVCIPGAVARPSLNVPSPSKVQRSRGTGDVHSGIDPASKTASSGHGKDEEDSDGQTQPGIGSCPNPAHRGAAFVHHAEERFTWEHVIAGCTVGGSNGVFREPVGVPVMWRGCSRGCLDFLDGDSGACSGDGWNRQDLHVDIGDDNHQQDGVQVVQLGAGALEDEALFE